MNNFEVRPDKKFSETEIRNKVADALEEHMTDPKFSRFYEDPHSTVTAIREGKKIRGKLFYETIVRIGQDLRLTPDQIDELVELIFEKNE